MALGDLRFNLNMDEEGVRVNQRQRNSRGWLLLSAALVALSPGVVNAQAEAGTDCEAAYAGIPHDAILDLLDPDAAEDRRSSALAHYERLAGVAGCPEFGYTLAQLYRNGPDLPGNPLERDTPKAREFLLAMAEDGYLPAYADLAEMQMRAGAYREAMQWTQVYLHFVRKVKQPMLGPDDAQFNRAAYNGHLLYRAEVVWRWQRPAVPRKRVTEDLNVYLSTHGKQVEQRMRERHAGQLVRNSAQDGPGLRVLTDMGDCRLVVRDRVGAATASWIVEVLPSGRTGRVVLENFIPSVAAAERLWQECMVRYSFVPFEGGQSRTVRLSVQLGSPEGASARR